MSYTKSDFNPLFIDPNTNLPVDKLSNTNNVRIIEPNPIGQIVPHEDLFIYVSLRANQKSKTLIEQTSNGEFSTTTDVRNSVNLAIPQQSVDNKGLFTPKTSLGTDWTEIGSWKNQSNNNGLYQDLEGFGITNIDIEIKSQTAPKVVIDFIDVRGATLFEQGSCSPYGLFFNLPYPIFELTVKGYYGKAVNYYLNLVKFNTKFNSETGNMECRAEFIGYTFAFLSDVIVSFVQASQNLQEDTYQPQQILQNKYEETRIFYESNGVKYEDLPGDRVTGYPWCGNPKAQSSKKCTTIMDLLNSLKDFDTVDKANISGSNQYNELTDLLLLEQAYQDYLKKFTELIGELENITLNSNTSFIRRYVTKETGNYVNNRQLRFVFYKSDTNSNFGAVFDGLTEAGGLLDNYFNKNTGFLTTNIQNIFNRKISDQNVNEYTKSQDPSGKGITCLLQNPDTNFTTPTPNLYDADSLNKTGGPLPNTGKPWFIGTLKVSPLSYTPITGELDYAGDNDYVPNDNISGDTIGTLDLGYILQDINVELDLLNNPNTGIITKKRKEVIDAVNKIAEARIGFKPTIRNIFTVLLCNTDAFMQILLNVAFNAENYHINEKLQQNTNERPKLISGTNKIYPWPTYMEPKTTSDGTTGTKEVYPGKRFPSWPEVIFVEDFIKAFLKLKDQIDVLNEKTEGKPGYDNFVPINPIESQYWEQGSAKPIKYLGQTGLQDRYLTIGERIFLTLDHTYFQPIRLNPDGDLVPKIGTGNWNPLKNEFIEKLASIDAWNLANTLDNTDDLNGTISDSNADSFIQKVYDQLNKRNGVDGGVFKTVKYTEIAKLPSSASTIGFDTGDYYVFKTNQKGINIKTSTNGEVWVKPNPLDMATETDTENTLFKILSPEELSNVDSGNGIKITNDDFKKLITDTSGVLKTAINGVDFSTEKFNKDVKADDKTSVWPGDLISWESKQNIFSFDKPQLFTTLAMSFDADSKINSWWTSGNLSSSSIGGPLVSNMAVISYWDSTGSNETQLLYFPPKPTNELESVNFIESNNNGQSIKIDILPADKDTAAFTTTLINTPLWLDNVKKFRDNRPLNDNYEDNDQYKNLAYLFLNTLKTSPFILRILTTSGYFKIEDQTSLIWSLKAFNTAAGISKVPKAWLLALGSQLWRWGEFVNDPSKKINGGGWTEWNKILTCKNCNQGTNLPKGVDPLIQPGWDSYDNEVNTLKTTSYPNDGVKFRNDKLSYLNYVYNATNTRAQWASKWKSVFGSNQQNSAGRKLFNIAGADVCFYYFNFYRDKLGQSLIDPKYLEKDICDNPPNCTTDTNFDALRTYYAWPQVYIAPHHIPYIAPEIFDNGSFGEGADFTMLTYDYVGYQDYVTMMPTKRDGSTYYEDGNTSDDKVLRSIDRDGNLGFIMQSIPDTVKNSIVKNFETWVTSDEWVNLLKIIDPINFNPSATLGDSYTFLYGQNSPIINDSDHFGDNGKPEDDGTVLSLKDNTKLSDLLTQNYGILNSTPKIWYGYDNGFGDSFTGNTATTTRNIPYDDGFVVSKTQFETYLKKFYETYKDAKKARLKELENQNKDNNNGLGDTVLDDDDTKLSLYRTFKSITDKWISASDKGKLFFNITNSSNGKGCKGGGTGPKSTLASHFQYVNRVMGDIGDKAVIDINKLNELRDNLKITLYQYISDLLTDNEYLFFPLPTYINFTGRGVSDEDLKDMFRPSLLDINDISCGPLFLCMYVGGNSRQLKLKTKTNCPFDQKALDSLTNIEDDGFSFSQPQKLPTEISDPTKAGSDGYTAFRVMYGLENQNHFKNIQLDQSEFSETAESLLVIDKLSQQGGSDKSSKGQNLNTAYLTRAYTCTIESLGNMMIQPMTYFDLQGVPMFSGAYIITEVRHNIKPNHATTTFKGSRQPRATIPIVTDVAIAMNLSFNKTGPTGQDINTAVSTARGTPTSTDSGSVSADDLFVENKTPMESNSTKTCPAGTQDGGTAVAYQNGDPYNIRLCKPYNPATGKYESAVNLDIVENINRLLIDAQKDGIPITLGSTFRTMQEQIRTAKGKGCYDSGTFVYADCDPAVATPGNSNHQMGKAIDFQCNGKGTIGFPDHCGEPSDKPCKNTKKTHCTSADCLNTYYAKDATGKTVALHDNGYNCYQWLVKNAAKYGLKSFSGEAWHWSVDGG